MNYATAILIGDNICPNTPIISPMGRQIAVGKGQNCGDITGWCRGYLHLSRWMSHTLVVKTPRHRRSGLLTGSVHLQGGAA
jgi:hypothetical protein